MGVRVSGSVIGIHNSLRDVRCTLREAVWDVLVVNGDANSCLELREGGGQGRALSTEIRIGDPTVCPKPATEKNVAAREVRMYLRLFMTDSLAGSRSANRA